MGNVIAMRTSLYILAGVLGLVVWYQIDRVLGLIILIISAVLWATQKLLLDNYLSRR